MWSIKLLKKLLPQKRCIVMCVCTWWRCLLSNIGIGSRIISYKVVSASYQANATTPQTIVKANFFFILHRCTPWCIGLLTNGIKLLGHWFSKSHPLKKSLLISNFDPQNVNNKCQYEKITHIVYAFHFSGNPTPAKSNE